MRKRGGGEYVVKVRTPTCRKADGHLALKVVVLAKGGSVIRQQLLEAVRVKK